MLKLLGKVMFLCIILIPQLKASQSFISRTQLASTLTAEQKKSRPGSGDPTNKKNETQPIYQGHAKLCLHSWESRKMSNEQKN